MVNKKNKTTTTTKKTKQKTTTKKQQLQQQQQQQNPVKTWLKTPLEPQYSLDRRDVLSHHTQRAKVTNYIIF